MPGDVEFYGSGSGRVRVEGLGKTLRALSKAGADVQDMKDLMNELGNIVIRRANPPVRSGRLKANLRAGKGKTKAVVRAGGARVPYAGVIEYGDPNRNIQGTGWLDKARNESLPIIYRRLDQGIGEILHKNNLN